MADSTSAVLRWSAPSGFRPSLTWRSSAARLRCCLPFMSRTSCPAHHALATLNEVVAGGMISWVLEADLKNFFASLSHDWVLRFVEHRVGDPRPESLAGSKTADKLQAITELDL